MSNTIRIKTEYGLQVLATKDWEVVRRIARFIDGRQWHYDRFILDMQKANCGWYIIIEATGEPLDNEYDLEAIYGTLKKYEM